MVSFGKTQAIGFSIPANPGELMAISPLNWPCRSDPQNLQLTVIFLK